jgi:hypothetical protein
MTSAVASPISLGMFGNALTSRMLQYGRPVPYATSSLEFLKEGAIRMRFKVVDFALEQHVCGVFLLVTLIDPLQRRLRCYGQVNKGLTHF